MIGGAKGIGIGLDFGIGNIKRPTKRDTLDPAIKEALCGVWIADQNTNESPTRNIIKNKISGKGGDFEILNAAYKLNSGYGQYNLDWSNWVSDTVITGKVEFNERTSNKASWINTTNYSNLNFYRVNNYSPFTLSVNVQGLLDKGSIRIIYKVQEDLSDEYKSLFIGYGNGKHIISIPQCSIFVISLQKIGNNPSIEQIPNYQGAFCTDGVDDLIVSQKPVSEMLSGSNELTVVSMIHQITANETNVSGSLNSNNKYFSNVTLKDKVTGIYGYSIKHIDDYYAILINNILGDKNNYNERSGTYLNSVPEFSVEGCRVSSKIEDVSQVAWYWTLIAKRVLTTDEINQVIAYYNLDKYVAPDIYYDVKKQGLTNENHTEFGDKLIDYSGNGKDMQLYNFGWKLDSGVGKYEEDFTSWSYYSNLLKKTSSTVKLIDVGAINPVGFIIWEGAIATNSFKVKVTGIPKDGILRYTYKTNEFVYTSSFDIKENGKVYELPSSDGFSSGHGFILGNKNTEEERKEWVGLTIEQLPSFEGAVVLDGATDYGQYVGDLGLKDYTVVADRAYSKFLNRGIPIISSTEVKIDTPFIMEYDTNSTIVPYSFGTNITLEKLLNIDRKISYQSAYVYNGNSINRGTSINTGNGLTFGRFGAEQQYAALCLYSFMLFPYTLSEFLLERQLKKRKLGTLYPDMVEWRPVINADMSTIFDISFKLNDSKTISVGEYIPINSGVSIRIDLIKYQLDEVSLLKVNGQAIQMRELGDYWKGDFTVTKSPQKIDITIDEYIRYEDIVMPYPFIPNLYWDDEFKNPITYGDKLKVGSTIYGHLDRNILPELYTRNRIIYKGATVNRLPIVVEKQMVFGVVSKVYLKDNEPKCILSPERLSIPNSSYKILGYIPDISGHGNHGKLNNSAYAGGSGANGYPYNYKEGFATQGKTEILNDNKVLINGLSSAVNFIKLSRGYKGKIAVTGITKNINTNNIFELKIYTNTNNSENTEAIHVTSDGIYDVNISGVEDDATNVFFFVVPRMYNDNFVPITIQQIGKYDGSYGLDGVDDFISIPTLSAGGKQVLMKVNWNNETGAMLYDQRTTYNTAFAIYVNGSTIAYNSLNAGGNTYIDGTLNNSITCMALKDITHNTTCLNSSELPSQSPKIGTNFGNSATFSTMSLYTFMLFDEISTEEKIKELNEIVGIEGNTNDLFNPTN